MFWRGHSFLTLIYLAIGVWVASDHHYLEHFSTVEKVISALLAIVLWPLVLLHVNLHLKG